MGLTCVDVELYNRRNGRKGKACSFLIDSGAVYSVVPASILKTLNIKPQREDTFTLANGERAARGVGEIGFRFQGREATCPVVFGEAKDVFLLGAVTLETLGYVLDPFRRELRPLARRCRSAAAHEGTGAGAAAAAGSSCERRWRIRIQGRRTSPRSVSGSGQPRPATTRISSIPEEGRRSDGPRRGVGSSVAESYLTRQISLSSSLPKGRRHRASAFVTMAASSVGQPRRDPSSIAVMANVPDSAS